MSDQGNMICPACEKFQPKAELCASCGVVIAKAHKPDAPLPKQSASKPDGDGLPVKAIGIVAVIMIAGGVFFFSGDDQPGDEESKQGKTQIEKLAAIKPKVASRIQVTKTQSTLNTLKTKLYMLSMEWQEPPTTEQGLSFLVQQGNLTNAEITDSWGRRFAYKMEWTKETAFSREYEINVHSLGADGLSNTADDIGMP